MLDVMQLEILVVVLVLILLYVYMKYTCVPNDETKAEKTARMEALAVDISKMDKTTESFSRRY